MPKMHELCELFVWEAAHRTQITHHHMVAAAIEPFGCGLLMDEHLVRTRACEELYEHEKRRYDLWLRRYLTASQTQHVIPAEAGIHDTSPSRCGDLRGYRPAPA